MNKKYIVRLTDEEREYLNGFVTKGKTSAYVIRYANILLKADADSCAWTDEQIADKAVGLEIVGSVSHETVRQTLKKMS